MTEQIRYSPVDRDRAVRQVNQPLVFPGRFNEHLSIDLSKYLCAVMSFFLLAITGCSTTSGTTLGEGTTLSPGWSRLAHSSKRAFRDPNVWAPLLAAALLQIDDLDHEISDRLREDTPIFGSPNEADDISSDLRDMTQLAYVSTALAAPGPDTPGNWASTKIKILGVEWLTVEAAEAFAVEIKDLTQRDRPNHENHASFPSAHATIAATQAQMAKLNLEYLPIESSSKAALGLALDALAAGTAWARVEAGKHYPSDVLAGWSVGHFFSQLGREFIAPDNRQLLVSPDISSNSAGIYLQFRF